LSAGRRPGADSARRAHQSLLGLHALSFLADGLLRITVPRQSPGRQKHPAAAPGALATQPRGRRHRDAVLPPRPSRIALVSAPAPGVGGHRSGRICARPQAQKIAMSSRIRFKFLPIAGILDRYVAAGFIRIFFISLAVVTLLYVTVDFFERVGTLLDSGASMSSIVRYFIYKAPLLISRVIGFATLFSALFSLGSLARSHEITAIRAGGITVQRIALPLLLLSMFLCGLTFVWNESLVPIFTHRAQEIYRTEIKNKQQQSLLGSRDIWIRGEGSFINVDNFDSHANTLDHVTVFLLNRDFSLRGLMEIPKAQWTKGGWQADQVTEWSVTPDGSIAPKESKAKPPLTETPEDLALLAR